MAIDPWVAHSASELKQRLQQLDVGTATELVFAEDLAGAQNAGIFFQNARGVVCAVGFNTGEVSVAEVPSVLSQVTALRPMARKKAGVQTVTAYM